MTPENLSSIFGVVLSLIFSYLPGAKGWYESLTTDYKRVVMLFGLALITAAAYGLACAGQYGGLTCDQPGLASAVQIFIAALIANQATYLISPKPAK